MPFYEFEITIDELNEFLKEKNESERKAYEKQSSGMGEKMGGVSSQMSKMKPSSYKLPTFKPPKF
jgi:hypothetical protein